MRWDVVGTVLDDVVELFRQKCHDLNINIHILKSLMTAKASVKFYDIYPTLFFRRSFIFIPSSHPMTPPGPRLHVSTRSPSWCHHHRVFSSMFSLFVIVDRIFIVTFVINLAQCSSCNMIHVLLIIPPRVRWVDTWVINPPPCKVGGEDAWAGGGGLIAGLVGIFDQEI